MNDDDIRRISYRALRKWGYTQEQAEQEARVALFELQVSGKEMEYPKSYLSRLLINKEIDKIKYRPEFCEYEEAPVTCNISEDFYSMTQGLRHKQRRLLFLHFVMGYSYPEISERTGLKEGTIKSRLSRIYEELRSNLGRGQ